MSIFGDFKYYNKSNIRILYVLIFDRGTSAVFLHRISYFCNKHHLKFISVVLRQINIILNNCEISYNTDIGVGLKIYHSVGIVIGDVKIGNGCAISKNITIGKNSRKESNGRRTPIIGNNVIIYSGSVVVGPIIVGDNVRIGANSVVTEDIPKDAKIIAVKPIIVE